MPELARSVAAPEATGIIHSDEIWMAGYLPVRRVATEVRVVG
jgi:hypothetical protein